MNIEQRVKYKPQKRRVKRMYINKRKENEDLGRSVNQNLRELKVFWMEMNELSVKRENILRK